MVSRRSHQKSRLGCAQCKRRRIKCDERHPTCSNCSKHSISCDFSPGNGQITSPPLQPPTIGIQDPILSETSSRKRPAPSPSHILNGSDPHAGDLHMQDLELLHHFTTETCFTTSNRTESHLLWRVTVPKEAFGHDFLMRAILATSALHLSHLRPADAEHYRHIAHSHQDRALSTFQSIMPNISQFNCHASFAFSSLVVVHAFASPRSPRSLAFTDQMQESADWLLLIRGVNSILQTVWPFVENGPLRGLLQPGMHHALETRLPKAVDSQLNSLVELCQRSSEGDDAVAAYTFAAQALRNCYAKIFTRASVECEIATAFTWPVAVPEEFIRLLNMRKPEALVILAHYCVVLHHLDDYWWLRGWATHLVHNIYSEIDEPWQGWIQWPSDVIDRNEKCLVWRLMTPEVLTEQTPTTPKAVKSN